MLVNDPPVEVAENLWMLGTNAYPLFLVRGKGEAAVFEGGVGAMGPLLLEQLDRIGVRADSVDLVVVTHAHPDHVMAVPLMRKAYHAVRKIPGPATVVGQDRVGDDRRGCEAPPGLDEHIDIVRSEHLYRSRPRRLGQRVRVHAQEQRTSDSLGHPVLGDRL